LDTSCEKEEVLRGIRGDRNSLHSVKLRKVTWFGLILGRNCLLKRFAVGRIKGMEIKERSRKQILDCVKKIERSC
jgi:hypothetical protein